MYENHIRKTIPLSEHQFEHAIPSEDSIIGFLIHLNPRRYTTNSLSARILYRLI